MKIRGEYKIINLSLIKPNSWNPKDSIHASKENKFQYEILGESIESSGFLDPILVRRVNDTYEVIDGLHRYLQVMEKGHEQISVIDLGIVSDEEAKSLTIRSEVIKVQVNNEKLINLVKDIFSDLNQDIDRTVSLLPFEKSQVIQFLNLNDLQAKAVENINDQIVGTQAIVQMQPVAVENIKSNEIQKKDLGNFASIFFKYEYQKYLNILSQMQTAKEQLQCDTNEELLEIFLQDYV